MKKHNIVKVVLITLLVILLLSWILPAAYYQGEYVDQGRVQMGLFELFNYPFTALSYFGHISLFVILVGCFYGVLYKIPAYRTYLDWIVAKFERKEILFISLVVILLACGVSIAGLNIAFMLFIPLFASVILLMGYDKIVAALTIVGGISAGLIGSTYAYNNLSLLHSVLSLENDYQIAVRFIILAASVILVLFNIIMYIKKGNKDVVVLESNDDEKIDVRENEIKEKSLEKEEVSEKEEKNSSKSNEKKSTKSSSSKKSSGSKKSSSKSGNSKSGSSKSGTNKSTRGSKNPNKAALKQEDIIVVKDSVDNSSDDGYLIPGRVDVTHKVWPFVVGFFLLFVLLVMAFITWGENGFGITLFDDITENVKNFELFGFPIFAKVYGNVNSFGNWTVVDLFLPIVLLTLLLAIIYKVKMSDIMDGIASGAKKALTPAFIILLLYTILVTVTYHPFQLSIYKAVLELAKGYNVFTTTIVALLSSIFNVDPAYVFQGVVPYYISVVTSAKNYASAAIVFQTMYGFASLFAPTSIILMTVLSYLNVGYKEWLKSSWKLILEVLAILLIIFMILIV